MIMDLFPNGKLDFWKRVKMLVKKIFLGLAILFIVLFSAYFLIAPNEYIMRPSEIILFLKGNDYNSYKDNLAFYFEPDQKILLRNSRLTGTLDTILTKIDGRVLSVKSEFERILVEHNRNSSYSMYSFDGKKICSLKIDSEVSYAHSNILYNDCFIVYVHGKDTLTNSLKHIRYYVTKDAVDTLRYTGYDYIKKDDANLTFLFNNINLQIYNLDSKEIDTILTEKCLARFINDSLILVSNTDGGYLISFDGDTIKAFEYDSDFEYAYNIDEDSISIMKYKCYKRYFPFTFNSINIYYLEHVDFNNKLLKSYKQVSSRYMLDKARHVKQEEIKRLNLTNNVQSIRDVNWKFLSFSEKNLYKIVLFLITKNNHRSSYTSTNLSSAR